MMEPKLVQMVRRYDTLKRERERISKLAAECRANGDVACHSLEHIRDAYDGALSLWRGTLQVEGVQP